MDLSKAKYIIPNLFTLTSVFGGFYAIVLTSRAESARELTLAVWMLVLSMVMDALDGRVARATRTQSEFGVQLDSLADAVAFGVAPAFLVFRWGLEPLGTLGLFVAFAFTACGLMRLARFNVMASQPDNDPTRFKGLPIPLAAGTMISIIMAHLSMTGRATTSGTFSVAIMTLLLAGLMVSNVPYRTFKKVRMRGRALMVTLSLAAVLVFTSINFNAGLAISGVLVVYIFIGLTESIMGLGRRRSIVDEAFEDDEQEATEQV